MNVSAPSKPHIWKFFRSGGLDQVALESGADLLALGQLDQKLWVALSCPVKGLELDEKTLTLIDSDKDGRIRAPELLAAVQWTGKHLNDVGEVLKGDPALPLASIDTSTPEGKTLLASAKQILANVGQRDATVITVEQATDTAKIFSASAVNGDGVIPPESTEDPAVQAVIKDIIACLGAAADRTGAPGVTAEKIDAFFTELSAYSTWVAQSATKDIAVLGDATEAACSAVKSVRAKVDDYFARGQLAAFDARALAALNRSETEYLAIAAKDMTISAEEVTGFPLARIESDKALPLLAGVNPAWAGALAALHKAAITPLFGAEKTSLTVQEWRSLNAHLAPYETWLGSKAGSAVEKLGVARVKEILAGPSRAALAQLVAQDKALEPEYKAISDVERLTRYYRDLRTLLNNFVNFSDFYSPDRYATFQAGTLYLDSRSTELCFRVEAPHALAAMAKCYIAYCSCTRAGSPAMAIAACFTQGDSDYLFVGRHGLFYDRAGRDWDAVITSIVENPISLRQAFWSPYKKFVRMIDEAIAKRAAAADAAANDKLAAAGKAIARADQTAADKTAAEKARVEPRKFDVGAVAAMGVAVGAIGGALAAVATGLASLPWWKYPIVVLAVILLISLPAVIIAALKLRQRTLGPILDGIGWAINGRVKINIPFGSTLTARAVLPPNSKRSLEDPYEDKDAARRRRSLIALLLLLLATYLTLCAYQPRAAVHWSGWTWKPWAAPEVLVSTTPPTAATPEAAQK